MGIASLCVAGQCQICEVCLMGNNKLLRGNRSTKFDAWHQDAFASPNFPTLGQFGIELEIELEHFIPAPKSRFKMDTKLFNNVVVIWLIPGFEADLLRWLLDSDEEIALVLSFYGVLSDKLKQLLIKAKKEKKT